jgi:hypothetical protein
MINLYDFLECNSNNINNINEDKVILYDISKVNYNKLNIGDKLLSTNNSIVEIKNIETRKDNLYKIHQKYGKSYIIYETQRLSLLNKNGLKVNIPVLEYIKHINDINNYVLLEDTKNQELSNNKKNINNNYIITQHIDNDNDNDIVKQRTTESFIEKKYEELLGNSDEDFIKINDETTYIEINKNIDKTNRDDIYYGYKNFIIFTQNQIKIQDEHYILEPYLFGIWYATHNITNFRKSSSKNHIQLSNEKQKRYIMSNISKYNLKLTKINNNDQIYYINHNNMIDIIELFIVKYNLANNYDIPKIYKYTNINDRLKVLSGILDVSFRYTYYPDEDMRVYIYVYNSCHKSNYIKDIIELANSLGCYTKEIENRMVYIYVKCEKPIGNILNLEDIENRSEILIERFSYDSYYKLEFNENSHQYLLDDYTILCN